jgi:hypothetical protein
MPIKIIGELIAKKNDFNIEDLNLKDPKDKKFFLNAQMEFTKHFDYFVGTSIGGLIAYCWAINYNILDMKEMYLNSKKYFKRNRLGPLIYSKYDPSAIHNKIDQIIDEIIFPGDRKISSKHATLLDLRNLLNLDHIIDEPTAKSLINKHGNFLEFVDEKNPEDPGDLIDESSLRRVSREKVLLITSYNTTRNTITILNTSYAKHWEYRIADVLKATMALVEKYGTYTAVNGHIRAVYAPYFYRNPGRWFTTVCNENTVCIRPYTVQNAVLYTIPIYGDQDYGEVTTKNTVIRNHRPGGCTNLFSTT